MQTNIYIHTRSHTVSNQSKSRQCIKSETTYYDARHHITIYLGCNYFSTRVCVPVVDFIRQQIFIKSRCNYERKIKKNGWRMSRRAWDDTMPLQLHTALYSIYYIVILKSFKNIHCDINDKRKMNLLNFVNIGDSLESAISLLKIYPVRETSFSHWFRMENDLKSDWILDVACAHEWWCVVRHYMKKRFHDVFLCLV